MKEIKQGGRPTKIGSEKKSYRVNIKMSTEEYYLLKARVSEAGISLSQYAREAISNSVIKQRISPEIVDHIRKLCGMANNLNQIARRANAAGFNSVKLEYLVLAERIDKLLNTIRK